MKKLTIRLCIFTLLLLGTTIAIYTVPELNGRTFFHPRSQNTNIARDMVTWYPIGHYKDMQRHEHIFTSSLMYNQSIRPKNIARELFSTNNITVTGSEIVGRDDNDLLADYFGLAQNFQSNVHLEPRIKSVIFTPGYLYNACCLLNGLYLKLQAPIAWTNWDLNIDEIVLNEGMGNSFPEGYMSQDEVTPTIFSFKNALKNKNSAFGSVK